MLHQIVQNNLPQTGVSLMFGYGSNVIKQDTRKESDLVDLILVVDDPLKWHQENYIRNNQHYSFLRYLPNNIRHITEIQQEYGAKIYFNTYVRLGNLFVKYGVIRTEHLINDLRTWSELYVAGRLHKPVEFIDNSYEKDEALRSAMRFNKESALRAALLQLPETFDLKKLYIKITGLSYHGDPRMIFGEDISKIENIVSSQFDRFDQLYLPMLKMNHSFRESVQWNETKQVFTQDVSHKTIFKSLKLLPIEVRKKICACHGNEAKTLEADVVLASVSRSINYDEIVARAIASTVRRSSLSQSLKGFLTAGFFKSLKYSQRKIVKSIASRLSFS